MKLASYNIMSGGFDGYDHTSLTPQRLPLLQAAIEQIDADVVGLVDTFRWDKLFTLQQLTQFFHYPYSFSVALHDKRLEKLGHDNGLTILSRQPLVTRQMIDLGTRNAIHVQVTIGTQLASIYVVYLDDINEATRLAQVDKLLAHIDPAEPAIIIGDMNTLRKDEATSGLEEFYSDNPLLAEKYRPVIDDMKQGTVVEKLLKAGLVDAGHDQALPTMPTRLFPAKVQTAFLRLDYCFHSTSLAVSEFTVIDTELTQGTSDHLPIVCEIEST